MILNLLFVGFMVRYARVRGLNISFGNKRNVFLGCSADMPELTAIFGELCGICPVSFGYHIGSYGNRFMFRSTLAKSYSNTLSSIAIL